MMMKLKKELSTDQKQDARNFACVAGGFVVVVVVVVLQGKEDRQKHCCFLCLHCAFLLSPPPLSFIYSFDLLFYEKRTKKTLKKAAFFAGQFLPRSLFPGNFSGPEICFVFAVFSFNNFENGTMKLLGLSNTHKQVPLVLVVIRKVSIGTNGTIGTNRK